MNNSQPDFIQITPAEWKLKVQAELAGLDYNQILVWDSAEGIQVKPVYTQEDLPKNVNIDFTQKDWKIIGNYQKNLDDSYLYGWNLKDSQLTDIQNIPPHLDLFFSCENSEELITQTDFSTIPNLKYLAFDPIGILAETGNWIQKSKEKSLELAQKALDNPSLEKALVVNASLYQNAGANHVQQIAYALAHANEYLNLFGAKTASKLYFKVAVGGNYFFEIAKLKSLRRLWKLILSEYSLQEEPFIYAENSLRNKSILDIHNNLIRSGLEASSAILGKADVVSIFPYDELLGGSTFAEELASKQQLLLQKESYYDKFHDPVAGSFFVENLVDLMCKNALDLFKKIEADGGFLYELMEGKIQKSIQKSADKEQTAFDEGKLVLIGVNKFRNPTETIENLPQKPRNEVRTIIPTIVPKRLATQIERTPI